MATMTYLNNNWDNSENVAKAVASLKTLLSEKYENLQLPPNGDTILERCLRRRNFNLAEAAIQVDLYFKVFLELTSVNTAKVLAPSFHKSYFFDSRGFVLLQQRDLLGRRIILVDYDRLPVDTFSLDHNLVVSVLIMNELSRVSVEDQKNGVVYVFNMKAMRFGHVKQYNLTRVKAIIKVMQGAIPVRIKAYHLVYNPVIFTYTYTLFKHLLKSKIRDRIIFHGSDLTEFHKTFGRDTLPDSLGGNMPIEKCVDTEFINKMCSRDNYYKELSEYGYYST